MSKRTGPTNPVTVKLIRDLKKLSSKENVKIWKAVAEMISKPSRQRPNVNLSKLEKYYDKKLEIIVPGKVLGDGILTKPVNVSALSASDSAKERIKASKGAFKTIEEQMKKNPKGKNLRIIV